MERLRIAFGLGVIAMIVGSGILMSLFLLREEEAQVSASDWQRLNTTMAEVIARQNAQTSPTKATTDAGMTTQSIPKVVVVANSIRINRASVAELDTLPGIGKVRATALVEERSAHGPYQDLDDIRARVPKIPASVLQQISQQITFED